VCVQYSNITHYCSIVSYNLHPATLHLSSDGFIYLFHGTTIEHAPPVLHLGHIPPTNWLVECCSFREHDIHFLHLGHIPSTNWLVERYSTAEHLLHVLYLGHIPSTNWLVERYSIIEHVLHVLHLGHIPSTNCLVECFCFIEHALHILHLGDIPSSNGLVECYSIIEHVLHVSNVGRVPCTNIVIEVPLTTKQLLHICHAGHVPVADVSYFSSAAARSEHQSFTASRISPSDLRNLLSSRSGPNILRMIERNDSDASIDIPELFQSRDEHVELFLCHWFHDLSLPSITHSNILKLRNNACHLNQHSAIECWLTSRLEGVPRSLDGNQKLVVLCGESIGNVVVTRKRCRVQVL